MSDPLLDPEPSEAPASAVLGKAAAVTLFVFGLALAAGTTIWGNPENTLHTSAQSWGMITAMLTGLGYGVAQVVPLLPWFRSGR